MEVPGQKHLVREMPRFVAGDLGESDGRGFDRVCGLIVDDALTALPGSSCRRNQIYASEKRGSYERIVQPFADLMAEALHVHELIADERAGFNVGWRRSTFGQSQSAGPAKREIQVCST